VLGLRKMSPGGVLPGRRRPLPLGRALLPAPWRKVNPEYSQAEGRHARFDRTSWFSRWLQSRGAC